MQVLLIIMMAHHSFYGVKLGRSFDLKGIALVVGVMLVIFVRGWV